MATDIEKIYNKKYYLEHREKRLAYHKKYVEKNIKKLKIYQKKYYFLNREKENQRTKKWAKENPEKIKKYYPTQLKYYFANWERLSKGHKIYCKQHSKEMNDIRLKRRHKSGISKRYNSELGISYTPQYKSMHRANRRTLFKNAGILTIQTIQEVYDENLIANGGVLKCIYCHKELTNKEATLEHKQPITKEGTNDKENLAIACGYCNCSKNNKTEKEFREYIKVKVNNKEEVFS